MSIFDFIYLFFFFIFFYFFVLLMLLRYKRIAIAICIFFCFYILLMCLNYFYVGFLYWYNNIPYSFYPFCTLSVFSFLNTVCMFFFYMLGILIYFEAVKQFPFSAVFSLFFYFFIFYFLWFLFWESIPIVYYFIFLKCKVGVLFIFLLFVYFIYLSLVYIRFGGGCSLKFFKLNLIIFFFLVLFFVFLTSFVIYYSCFNVDFLRVYCLTSVFLSWKYSMFIFDFILFFFLFIFFFFFVLLMLLRKHLLAVVVCIILCFYIFLICLNYSDFCFFYWDHNVPLSFHLFGTLPVLSFLNIVCIFFLYLFGMLIYFEAVKQFPFSAVLSFLFYFYIFYFLWFLFWESAPIVYYFIFLKCDLDILFLFLIVFLIVYFIYLSLVYIRFGGGCSLKFFKLNLIIFFFLVLFFVFLNSFVVYYSFCNIAFLYLTGVFLL